MNSVFDCCNNLLPSLVDRVSTGTYTFESYFLIVAFIGLLTVATAGSASLVALLIITQFSDQVKIRSVSQLINGISSVIWKLLKCFNGATISTAFSVLLSSNLPVILVL